MKSDPVVVRCILETSATGQRHDINNVKACLATLRVEWTALQSR